METVSSETIAAVRAKAGLDEKKIRRAVDAIKDWLQQQPHLPHQHGNYAYSYNKSINQKTDPTSRQRG
jgi:hypothetical protein